MELNERLAAGKCVPGEEEWLGEVVVDVDDEVVVGDGLDLRPRELVVDQDPLQTHRFSKKIAFAPRSSNQCRAEKKEPAA